MGISNRHTRLGSKAIMGYKNKEDAKAWRENHKEEIKKYNKEYGPKWFQENKERLRAVRTKNRDNNLEKYREKGRRDYANNKEANCAYQRKYRKTNAEKVKAHSVIVVALRNGSIKKPDFCSICLGTYRIESHHHDYTKPLEVVWVCSKCHKGLHI